MEPWEAKPTWMHSGKQKAISLITWINGSSLGFQWVNPCHEYTPCCLCRRQAWGGTFHGSLKQMKSGLPVSTWVPPASSHGNPASWLKELHHSQTDCTTKQNKQMQHQTTDKQSSGISGSQLRLTVGSSKPLKEWVWKDSGWEDKKESQYLQGFGVTCHRNALCVILMWEREFHYFQQIHANVLQFQFYCDWIHFFRTTRVTASWAEHRKKEKTVYNVFYF